MPTTDVVAVAQEQVARLNGGNGPKPMPVPDPVEIGRWQAVLGGRAEPTEAEAAIIRGKNYACSYEERTRQREEALAGRK